MTVVPMPGKPLSFTALMAKQPCRYCGAREWERCTTKSGASMGKRMHSARYYDAHREKYGSESR